MNKCCAHKNEQENNIIDKNKWKKWKNCIVLLLGLKKKENTLTDF